MSNCRLCLYEMFPRMEKKERRRHVDDRFGVDGRVDQESNLRFIHEFLMPQLKHQQ